MRRLLEGARLTAAMRNIIILRLLFVMANALGPFAALFFNRHYQLGGSTVALAITLVSASYLTGNLLGGVLANRYSFRGLLLGTALCSTVFLLLAMLFKTPSASIAMVLMFMLCAGLITPVFSVLTSLAADDGNRIAAFGYLHLASNLGTALLFVIGGYLINLHSNDLMMFAISVNVSCFLASVVLTLPERQGRALETQHSGCHHRIDVPPVVIVAGVLFFSLSVLDAQREYQFPLWLDEIAFDNAARIFSAVGIVNALLVILLTPPLIAFTSRLSAISNLAAAGIFYGIGFGAYALFEHPAFILTFVIFWTMGEILGITHITALISQKTSLPTQAKLFSLIPILLAIARMVSVGVGATLISSVGFMLSWCLYGLMGLLIGGIGVLLARNVTVSDVASSRER